VCTSGWAQLDSDTCVDCNGASAMVVVRALAVLLLIIAAIIGLLLLWNRHRIKHGRGEYA
jgi:hypothetical protein